MSRLESLEPPPQSTAPAAPGVAERVASARDLLLARSLALAWLAVAALGGTYLLLLKSPLRLAGDDIAYLTLAARMTGRFPAIDEPIHYPRGYPAVLALFDKIGLGIPWAAVAFNLICLAVGLAAVYVVLRHAFRLRQTTAVLICCLILLSRVVVWTAAVALTDVPFFALCALSLLLLLKGQESGGRRAWVLLAGGGVVAVGALELRTIGISLVPPFVFACVSRLRRDRFFERFRARPVLAACAAAVTLVSVLAVGFIAVRGTGYASAAGDGWHVHEGAGAVLRTVPRQLNRELRVIGELATNVTRTRLPDRLGSLESVVGGLALLVVLAGAWTRRRSLQTPDVFVASAAVVVFLWPGLDTRLWLPAFPFLLGYAALAVQRFGRSRTIAALACAAVVTFAAIGAFTLARSVRIALAGADFPHAFAEEASWTEPTYHYAFSDGTRVDMRQVRPRVLRLLRRYEPRARHPKTE